MEVRREDEDDWQTRGGMRGRERGKNREEGRWGEEKQHSKRTHG